VIAVAGGRPGVGHSIVSINLAVYLAQLGRQVVLVDSDPVGPSLHNMLGVEMPVSAEAPDPFETAELRPIPTPVPGLSLLPQQYVQNSTVPVRPGRKPRWAKGLRHLDADYIIVDLGPGTAPATLDLYLSADFGICVTAPDPPGVEATYRFLKAVYQRQVRKLLLKDRFRMRQVERALGDLPPLPSPLELVRTIGRYDSRTGEAAQNQLRSMRQYLITNMTRMRGDSKLGQQMVDLAERYLGVQLDDLGFIEHDEAIWLSVVRRRPLLIDNPTSKNARNVERIARRVVAVATSRDMLKRDPLELTAEHERSLYDVLWTHRGAGDEELRRAYKRQRDVFQPGGLALTSLLSDTEILRERGRVEEAQETLLDPVRRRAYDLSFFPDAASQYHDKKPAPDQARLLEQSMLRTQLAQEIHSETEFTGELLQRVRESLGIELEEIAQKTKISVSHLRAIESDAFLELPAEVYTRGFVSQVAQMLGLDATQATRTYVRRMRAARKGTSPEASR
jgi:flagellar biosynthesis protein FlhG